MFEKKKPKDYKFIAVCPAIDVYCHDRFERFETLEEAAVFMHANKDFQLYELGNPVGINTWVAFTRVS